MKKIAWAILLLAVVSIGYWAVRTGNQKQEDVKIYFLKNGGIGAVERQVGSYPSTEENVIKELVNGPNQEEKTKGYFTELPEQTKLISIQKQDGIVRANFNAAMGKYGGGTAKVKAIIAQIVYTLTEIQGNKKVQLLLEGKTDASLGSEGFVIDKPLSRQDVSK